MNNPSSTTPNPASAAAIPTSGEQRATPKFQVLAELGRGGMATVYLAVVQGPGGFNKMQVIKRLRPALAADPEFLQMFLEEARLAARINHPNIVQTNEVGYDGNYHYIAMEYLEGQSLEAITRRLNSRKKPPLPLDLHLRVLIDGLCGLHAAHELTTFDGTPLNVVHRDMSPHNVMVTYDGQVKVLDFGIAKAADSSSQTRTGIMKGKCAYMAVEQFGGKGVDRRVDVFAIGVMLWQALTGTRLWKGLSDAEIFQKLASGDIRPPSSVTQVDPEIEAICMKALSVQREARYSTAAELQAELERYLAKLPEHRGNRELGKFVGELFADTRANLAAVIEPQMKKVLAAGASAPGVSGQVPVVRATTGEFGASSDSLSDVGAQHGSSASSTTVVPQGDTGIFGAAGRPRRLILLGAFGLAALAVAGLAMSKLHSGETAHAGSGPQPSADPTTSVVTPAGGTAAVPTGATASTPAVVHLTAHAVPATAALFLDDVPLQGNPATATLPRDGVSHRIRAQAVGYAPKSELVMFNAATVTVDIALDHKAAPPPIGHVTGHGKGGHESGPTDTGGMTPPPPPPPTGPTAPTATGHGGNNPSLDTGDPWKP